MLTLVLAGTVSMHLELVVSSNCKFLTVTGDWATIPRRRLYWGFARMKGVFIQKATTDRQGVPGNVEEFCPRKDSQRAPWGPHFPHAVSRRATLSRPRSLVSNSRMRYF